MEENFCNPGLSRDFLATLQKAQSIKEKIDKLDALK